jgi:hypothetical protein
VGEEGYKERQRRGREGSHMGLGGISRRSEISIRMNLSLSLFFSLSLPHTYTQRDTHTHTYNAPPLLLLLLYLSLSLFLILLTHSVTHTTLTYLQEGIQWCSPQRPPSCTPDSAATLL